MDDSESVDTASESSPPSSPFRGRGIRGTLAHFRKDLLARKKGNRVNQLEDTERNGCATDPVVATESVETAESPAADRSRERAAIPLATSHASPPKEQASFFLKRLPPSWPKAVPVTFSHGTFRIKASTNGFIV